MSPSEVDRDEGGVGSRASGRPRRAAGARAGSGRGARRTRPTWPWLRRAEPRTGPASRRRGRAGKGQDVRTGAESLPWERRATPRFATCARRVRAIRTIGRSARSNSRTHSRARAVRDARGVGRVHAGRARAAADERAAEDAVVTRMTPPGDSEWPPVAGTATPPSRRAPRGRRPAPPPGDWDARVLFAVQPTLRRDRAARARAATVRATRRGPSRRRRRSLHGIPPASCRDTCRAGRRCRTGARPRRDPDRGAAATTVVCC